MGSAARCLAMAVALLLRGTAVQAQVDPLPSWNPGISKERIIRFVQEVTTAGGPRYLSPAERIAVFDNDGTLWSEQPIYFQFAFALDQVRAMAPQHPEWKEKPP